MDATRPHATATPSVQETDCTSDSGNMNHSYSHLQSSNGGGFSAVAKARITSHDDSGGSLKLRCVKDQPFFPSSQQDQIKAFLEDSSSYCLLNDEPSKRNKRIFEERFPFLKIYGLSDFGIIFTHNEFPGLIFKSWRNYNAANNTFHKKHIINRTRNAEIARHICAIEQLDHIIIPKTSMFNFECNEAAFTALAQEMVVENSVTNRQNPLMRRAYRQLGSFIFNANMADPNHLNILETGEKLAIVDFEYLGETPCLGDCNKIIRDRKPENCLDSAMVYYDENVAAWIEQGAAIYCFKYRNFVYTNPNNRTVLYGAPDCLFDNFSVNIPIRMLKNYFDDGKKYPGYDRLVFTISKTAQERESMLKSYTDRTYALRCCYKYKAISDVVSIVPAYIWLAKSEPGQMPTYVLAERGTQDLPPFKFESEDFHDEEDVLYAIAVLMSLTNDFTITLSDLVRNPDGGVFLTKVPCSTKNKDPSNLTREDFKTILSESPSKDELEMIDKAIQDINLGLYRAPV